MAQLPVYHMTVMMRARREHTSTIRIPVYILDVRKAFGRVDYQITPVGGSEFAWVEYERAEFIPEPPTWEEWKSQKA